MSGYKNAEQSPFYFRGSCSYPNCHHKKIEKDAPFVEWHGVSFTPEQVADELSPMAKLATVANPSWDSTDKVYYAVVTGVSAGTAVITVKDSTGLISSTATVNVTSAIAKTVTITFDKATYAAGEKMTVSINATNAAGAKIADGTYTAFLTGALVASASLTSALYGADLTFDDGIATATAYAPLSSGPLSVTATIASSGAFLDSALLSTTVTGTTKVSGTAELASLTTLVNSLLTKINAMQKLLNKIQKKLGVK